MAVKEQTQLRLSGEPLTDETIQTMAESFKALADPTPVADSRAHL